MIGRLGVIHRTSLRLHAISDPELMAREIVGILQDVVPHDFAAVYLLDGEALIPFAVSDRKLGGEALQADKEYLASLELRVGANITGWVAQHGKSQLIRDVSRDPRYLDSQPGVQSELCVPMYSGRGLIGVVNLESLRRNAYSQSEQRVLEIVAAQLGIAIENATMRRRLQAVERSLEALAADLADAGLGTGTSGLADRVTALAAEVADLNTRPAPQYRDQSSQADEATGVESGSSESSASNA